jgi:hypothetical protein
MRSSSAILAAALAALAALATLPAGAHAVAGCTPSGKEPVSLLDCVWS